MRDYEIHADDNFAHNIFHWIVVPYYLACTVLAVWSIFGIVVVTFFAKSRCACLVECLSVRRLTVAIWI